MTIRFTKMHGLGNDFIVIDAINQNISLNTQEIRHLSRRDIGIGFDQCLLIEQSHLANVDFFYRIFNADGSEVGQCGNGARCLARFVSYYGLTTKSSLTIATSTTQMHLQINPDNTVTVSMPRPNLDPAIIPLYSHEQKEIYSIDINNQESVSFNAIYVGNPHAVILVDNASECSQRLKLEDVCVTTLGRSISEHCFFPEQINVGFMEVISPKQIKLRVYERGVGETQACGSGAVAAAAIGQLFYGLSEEVLVSLPGGNLIVNWPQNKQNIYLTGPAEFIYEGRLFN